MIFVRRVAFFILMLRTLLPAEKMGAVALYIVPDSLGGSLSKTLSISHMVSTAGIPFDTTSTLDSALESPMLIFTSRIKAGDLSTINQQKLQSYVESNRTLIVPRLNEAGLYATFGISAHESASKHYSYHYETHADTILFSLFDERAEQHVQFGDTTKGITLTTVSFTPQEAEALAYYDDQSAAITRYKKAYLWGLSWKDIGVRYLLNMDYNAGRVYSNGFEPDLDMTILLLREIYRQSQETTITKSLSPYPDSNVVIITHDCDSRTAMEQLLSFARFEEKAGIRATFMITTHYIDDDIAGDYFTPFGDTIAKLAETFHEIASHSVGHFPDFGDDDFPIGTVGNRPENYLPSYSTTTQKSSNASIYGELEVSKALLEKTSGSSIYTFRSGHLTYPKQFINVLEETGYRYNSSRSANDITTTFPYRTQESLTFSASLSPIYEFPLVISDVYSETPMDSLNWLTKVAIWDSVTTRYHRNESPVVLLIHPNRQWKLRAESTYVALNPSRTYYGMEQFMRFWEERDSLQISSIWKTDTLEITLSARPSPQFSLDLSGALPPLQIRIDDTLLAFTVEEQGKRHLIHSIGKTTDILHSTSKPSKVSLQRRRHYHLLTTEQYRGSAYIHSLSGQLLQEVRPTKRGTHYHYTIEHLYGSGVYILSLAHLQYRFMVP